MSTVTLPAFAPSFRAAPLQNNDGAAGGGREGRAEVGLSSGRSRTTRVQRDAPALWGRRRFTSRPLGPSNSWTLGDPSSKFALSSPVLTPDKWETTPHFFGPPAMRSPRGAAGPPAGAGAGPGGAPKRAGSAAPSGRPTPCPYEFSTRKMHQVEKSGLKVGNGG